MWDRRLKHVKCDKRPHNTISAVLTRNVKHNDNTERETTDLYAQWVERCQWVGGASG